MLVQVGTGSQILVMTLLIFALALLSGTFHPYSRGALLSSIIVLYAITAGAHARRACTQELLPMAMCSEGQCSHLIAALTHHLFMSNT